MSVWGGVPIFEAIAYEHRDSSIVQLLLFEEEHDQRGGRLLTKELLLSAKSRPMIWNEIIEQQEGPSATFCK